MLLRMIYDDALAQAAYLVGCQKTGEAIVFDPERDIDRYTALAKKEGLRIVAAAETHIHADFLSGVREFAEAGATAYLSGEGGPDWSYAWASKKPGGGSYAHRLLKHGEVFGVGNIEFKALHTPGHTPEHMVFLVTDRGGGATEPMGMISGDFLFVGDLGRPDLLETAAGQAGASEPSAKRLFQTVGAMRDLPDYLQVWPGHGAGSACGKALGAVPQTTLGYERRFNPALRAAGSEAGFVSFILSDQPEPPLYFARMKRDNKAGPRVLGKLPTPRAMTPAELAGLDAKRVALIDTRAWAAFRAGHVPGSLFHPLNNSFVTDAGSMVGEGETICLIVEPSRLEEAVRGLVRIGLDDIAGWFDPAGLGEYQKKGGAMATTPEVSPEEARAMLGGPGVFSLDVRRMSEYRAGHLRGAACIAHTRLAANLEKVPRGQRILVNCQAGGRSARACALLQKRGYEVMNLAGGFRGWEQSGAPVER